MNTKFKNTMSKLCEELISKADVVGILLYGSLANNNYHSFSDIDLYVVRENVKHHTQFFYIDEVPVHIIWRSVETFKEKILKGNTGVNGKILYDPTGLLKEYQEKAQAILHNGPTPLSTHDKTNLHADLSIELNSIYGLLEKNEVVGAVLLINELTLTAIRLYYDLKGWWMTSQKHIISDFKTRNCELGCLSEQIILESEIKIKLNKFCILREKVLNLLGGELNSFKLYW